MPAPARYGLISLERTIAGLDTELTYALSPGIGDWQIGQPVVVPLRRGRAVGFITGFTDQLDFDVSQLKTIDARLSDEPLFDELALKIARWMSAYYHCPLPDALAGWIPAGATPALDMHYQIVAPEPLRALRDLSRTPKLFSIANAIWEAKKPLNAKEIGKAIGGTAEPDQLRRLCETGVLAISSEAPRPPVRAKLVSSVKIARAGLDLLADPDAVAALSKRAPKQAEALCKLAPIAARTHDWLPIPQLHREAGVDSGAIRSLAARGLVAIEQIESLRLPNGVVHPQAKNVVFTDEQANAVAQIADSLCNHGAPQTVLLQGVTASGKTEVYLAAIEKCLELGKNALLLVPEIALTAQTVEIFQKRFGSKVAILHSALSAGERFDEWRRAGRGDAPIVVGARSAIFAPLRNVGLIIIDEEHDGSYKQDKAPRYHAREIALRRCALEGAVLLLGSATPSLESFARATRGEYRHVMMRKRVENRAMPAVEIVDMTSEAQQGALPVLSKRLKDELCATVSNGEQAILFLNRRGFATYVQCLGCGHAEKCPNCDVSLTHHKAEGTLRCHHCDHVAPVPGHCPVCDGWMLSFSGSGTEKVEKAVDELFAERGLRGIKSLRLDRDTTSNKGAHGQILGDFRAGRAQVLIGTQMVTKGLDFPRVTLVGVISADTALNVPDFRASERTFQLLAQVAGRAGRGATPGRVLVQTLAADDIAITTAAQHDFATFVAQEIENREMIPNPPFSHVVNVISSHEDEATARTKLERLAARFQAAIVREPGTDLLGPVSCPLARVKNKFRFHLLLRDRSRPRLHRRLQIYDDLPREEKEGLTVDVDALTIL